MKNLLYAFLIFAFSILGGCNSASETKAQKSDGNDVTGTENKGGDDENYGKTVHLTKDTFLEKVMNYEKNRDNWVYEGDKPCIIDFYADWCKPCKLIAPIMEELAQEYAGQVYIYKVDTQKERELAGVFGIRSIPSVLFVPMEGKPQMSQGALPKETFKQVIDNFLLNQEQNNTQY